ncbi:HAD family hydrolase [Desulforhopalus singaporensis]|uniref:HAD family phosphatase n=1 Tax=Desulforhopalus singaporensis TaxID=91360 RepID=A0A1H0TN12_9BACT|nr:HAD family hydrolase [Desulforhopalus singaporensis]SDP54936.1 hypothetical protein SAMN05660330_03147 [Desulforhopalus singaporensis]
MKDLVKKNNTGYRPVNSRKLFVTDLDGTLLTDGKVIRKTEIDTLAALQDRDIVTAIATGRSFFSFNKLVAELQQSSDTSPLPVDYVIFSTGAGIMNFPRRDILKSFSLPHGDVVRVCGFLEMLGIDYMVQRPVPQTNHFIYKSFGGENHDFQTRLGIYGEFATPLTDELLLRFGPATQVLAIVPAESGHQAAAKIKGQFPELSVIKATSPLDHTSIWIEIFAPEVNKSTAINWLCENIGLHRRGVCAVGNDYNDEDMLRWAGISFVTENTPSSLKALYANVASNNDGGVSEAAASWLKMT